MVFWMLMRLRMMHYIFSRLINMPVRWALEKQKKGKFKLWNWQLFMATLAHVYADCWFQFFCMWFDSMSGFPFSVSSTRYAIIVLLRPWIGYWPLECTPNCEKVLIHVYMLVVRPRGSRRIDFTQAGVDKYVWSDHFLLSAPNIPHVASSSTYFH